MAESSEKRLSTINNQLNRARPFFGMALLAILAFLLLSLLIFLAVSMVGGTILFPALLASIWYLTKGEPKRIYFWVLSFFHFRSYDPAN